MKIIIRACGERTEKKCIQLAKKQGTVYVVKAHPFGETMRQSYKLAMELRQEWIPMVDADVLLYNGVINRAIAYLKSLKKKNIFCLDGKTNDKIFLRVRRAGIHIYKTDLLPEAIKFINDKSIKPETHVRKVMIELGYKTDKGGKILFGAHDYEQYYRDLWRKSVAQTQKLAGLLRRSKVVKKWQLLSRNDNDFKVILAAHRHGMGYEDIYIDSRIDYGAAEGLRLLGLKEKGKLK